MGGSITNVINERIMTREDIEQLNVVEPYCFESDREEQWYNIGLKNGLEIADEHPVNVWHDAKIFTPTQDKEVIVLCDDIHCGSNYKIAFGHIVDKTKCVDYNGWNIPNVVLWMPCPQIPYEKEE